MEDQIFDQWRDYIDAVRWQTSKDGSHQYTVRKWSPELDQTFVDFARFIRENGYIGVFMKRQYIYLDLDGFKYWTMGYPLDVTIIINRAWLKDADIESLIAHNRL